MKEQAAVHRQRGDTLKKAVVSFIDILGFAAKVEQITTNAELVEIKKSVCNFVSNLRADAEFEIDVWSFSDCVIRVAHTPDGEDLSRFVKSEIERLCKVQLWCAADDLVIRGGISHGYHWAGDLNHVGAGNFESIISPALIRAHRLESKCAKVPRILVDNDLVDLLGLTSENYLRHDEEPRLYYLDYLMYAFMDAQELEDERFEDHRRVISRGLKAADLKVRQKYEWLRAYHNSSLAAMLDYEWLDGGEEEAWEGTRQSFDNFHREFMSFVTDDEG